MPPIAYMKGWITGFFDGEGCVCLYFKKGKKGTWGHYQYFLNASSTDLELVETAKAYLSKLGVASRIDGPYKNGGSLKNKLVWRINVYGAANIVAFDRQIGFRCKSKAAKFSEMIAYIKRDGPRKGPVTWRNPTSGQLEI